MVSSFQILFPEVNSKKKDEREMSIDLERNSVKRKWHNYETDNIQLHFDTTPLPSEWQRCLDIQSGKIDFYNTRTHKRTESDPREETTKEKAKTEVHSNDEIGLDLELNLLPFRHRSSTTNKKTKLPSFSESLSFMSSAIMITKQTHNYNPKAPEGEEEEEEAVVEMVATACVRCHMLVMLCKSSPKCPSCKFVHPPYQTHSLLLDLAFFPVGSK